ncbi:MAG TPA: hypothetical protein DCF48_04970, partial [Rikenellaceae bacterium]|nr:hypothetical protein [Rikenellaceae bacterium]
FAVNAEADCVQALQQGKADVFVTDEIALPKPELERLHLKRAFLGKENFNVAFALRKGTDELRAQLDRFIASAPIEQIVAHWIEGTPLPEEPYYEITPGAAPLKCISCSNTAPICFDTDGGAWIGMDPDILRWFAHSIGRPFEMKYIDIGSAMIALQKGQVDIVCGCIFITDERLKSVDFSLPYYQCHPGYFVRDHRNKHRITLGERFKMNLVTENRWKLIADGLLETLKITLLSILLGTLLGFVVCQGRRSRHGWARYLASLYGEFINGIPTLVLLLIMFYVVFAKSGLNASMIAVVTFSLCFASSAGSIFDTAISSVPPGQTEAGLSLGFTPFRTFTDIVFPQAVSKGLPLYIGECISLLKSTSIVGYIAIQDITRASDIIRSRTFDALIPLLVVTVLYFVVAWLIQVLLNLLLKKH